MSAVNVSEGAEADLLERLRVACGPAVLDLHADRWHNRAVFTVAGVEAPRTLAVEAVAHLDIGAHRGAHPRLGVVDVVPFTPFGTSTMADALEARDSFARWAAVELDLPCFLYGPERSLPDIRRHAFERLAPDIGPPTPHPTAGAVCVGARGPLVAFNVWLPHDDLDAARSLASAVRGPRLRALGFLVGDRVQVSMNLVDPLALGPGAAFDAVAALTAVERAELVGVVPAAVLAAEPRSRWAELDLAVDRTVEHRLAEAGFTP